ncbi:MAG: hypothetical protein BWK79_07795 [Beggiatoa sp. IS2]|nr:MAG: hypothetical protein BWK79_07795 [Beggiatoa sp. IS2]
MSLKSKREQEKQRKLAKKQARALKQTGQSDLSNAEIYNNRGIDYAEQGEFELALDYFNKAIELNINFSGAYNNRGLIYKEQGKFDLALVDYNKAVELNSELAEAYNNRGLLYAEQKKIDLSLADYTYAIQLNYARDYNNRGLVYKEQGKLDLALTDYNKAIELDPKLAEAYDNRGLLYAEQKEIDLSLADYTYAIQLNYTRAYNNRGLVYKKQGKLDLALIDYNKAIELDPKLAESYFNRGILYSEQNKFDLALVDYNKVIELKPKSAEIYFYRGILYKKQKEFNLALADYNKSLQLNPNLAEVYTNRGILYREQNSFELALADYNCAIQLNSNCVAAYNDRGNVYREQEIFDLAFADYDKAIQLNRNSIDSYLNRGGLYLQQGKIDLALTDFEKAVGLDKRLKQPLFLLASRTLTDHQQFDKAEDYVKRAFTNAKSEERQHEGIYLQSIEQAQRLHKAYGRIQELVRQYSHNLGNTLFPDTLYNLAQTLKKDNNYQKEALQLYDVFNAEKTIMRQAELINIRQGQNDPKRFGELVQNSCLHHENEPGNNIQFVLNYALERMVARFLNEFYQKVKQPREKVLSKLGMTLDSLRENFEQSIFFNHGDIFTWVNQYLMPIEITEFSESWQKVKFKKEGHAETLFYSYFNEFFKYADYQQLTLRFYEQAIDNKYYLMSRWENHFENNQSNSTERGLQGIREDLSQLNLSEASETTLQIDIKGNLFVVTLAFRRDLLVYEIMLEQKQRIYNTTERLLAMKKVS